MSDPVKLTPLDERGFVALVDLLRVRNAAWATDTQWKRYAKEVGVSRVSIPKLEAAGLIESTQAVVKSEFPSPSMTPNLTLFRPKA